jgi:hypothetical protein
LVVEDYGDVVGCDEVSEGKEIVMWNAGATVKDDEGWNSGRRRELPEYCVPLYS